MRVSFAVRAWSAIAPGLQSPDQWSAWVHQPWCPQGAVQVDLSHVPAMQRRRLGPLAKMAVAVADQAAPPGERPDLPVVWASRYGDTEKSLALLQSQATDEPLSPTAFGLSVHNGVGAQHSILRGMRENALCIASSQAAPEAALVEAFGLLCDGAPEVMVVCYDMSLPGAYAQFHDEPQADFAWAVVVSLAQAGEPGFHLTAVQEALADAAPVHLPHGLNVLHFLRAHGRRDMVRTHTSGAWLWERVGA